MHKPLLPIAQLDDRTYEDLLEEARAAIPGLHPQWTDHNPADPGIALIELLAWLTEMIIYRVNQLPDQNYQSFIKLLGGPNGQGDNRLDPDTAILETVLGIGERYRAITREDYEYLVKHQWPKIPIKEAMQFFFNDKAELLKILQALDIVPQTPIKDLTAFHLSGLKEALARQAPGLKEPIRQQFRIEAADVIEALDASNFAIRRVQCVPQYNLARQREITVDRPEDRDHISLVVVPENTAWGFQLHKFSIPGRQEYDRQLGPPSGPCSAKMYIEWRGTQDGLSIQVLGPGLETIYQERPVKKQSGCIFEATAGQFEKDEIWKIRITNNSDAQIDGVMDVMFLPQQPKKALEAALWSFIDQRRLLTARHHVVGPRYEPVSISADLYLRKDALGLVVRKRATQRLRNYFHPFTGGPEHNGWPFGRNIYVSEVYEQLEKVRGIDHVDNVQLQHPDPKRRLSAPSGDGQNMIGIKLYDHELVLPDTSMSHFTARLI